MACAYSAGLLGGWAALEDAPPAPRRELLRVAGGGCDDDGAVAGNAAAAGAICCGTLAVISFALHPGNKACIGAVY